MDGRSLRFDDAGRLIGHDGALHPKIAWRSALERKLTFATKFPTKARRIAGAYERWLAPVRMDEGERAALEAWVVGAAPFFGSASLDHARALSIWRPALASFAAREAPALAAFLTGVLDPPARPSERGSADRRRVVIFHGDLGGGTRAAAEAVAELLRETDDFSPILLSVHEDVIGAADPFFQAFGVSESAQWNRLVLDQHTPGWSKHHAEQRAALWDHFVPASVEEAQRLVTEHRAEQVISLLPGHTLLAQIASPEVPLTILHPDFGLFPGLHEGPAPGAPAPATMFEPERITIGLSSDQPEPAIDALRAELGPRFEELVRVIGYPTRSAFRPPDSPREIERIRASLGVSADERVVLLMMGREGAGDRMIHLVRRLVTGVAEGWPPLHIVAVCGRSERARSVLAEEVACASPRNRLRITGHIGPDEVAAYMHIAAASGETRRGVVVSKPGGATVAECAAAGAYMLLVPGFPWEAENEKFAVRHGVGEACADDDLLPAIHRLLHEPPSPRAALVDFRARLLDHLRRPRR